MKQHLVLGAVGVLALVPVTATAQAAAPAPKTAIAMKTTIGKTVSFKGGKLRVSVGGKNVDFIVTKATECGTTRGNRSATMRCSNLGRKQYLAKRVRVGWHTDAKKRRVAAFIAVTLPSRR